MNETVVEYNPQKETLTFSVNWPDGARSISIYKNGSLLRTIERNEHPWLKDTRAMMQMLKGEIELPHAVTVDLLNLPTHFYANERTRRLIDRLNQRLFSKRRERPAKTVTCAECERAFTLRAKYYAITCPIANELRKAGMLEEL